MLRLISGTAKNKRLKAPAIEGFRGVQEVAKGATFSIISDRILDSTCLDLYSGSGNLGLEALSRGASWCDFVDKSKVATRVIEENVLNCNFSDKAEIHQKEAVKFVANTEKKYDIIFLDPFYHDRAHKFLMQNLKEILNPNGMIFFFHGSDLNVNNFIENLDLKIVDERRFGKSYITIITH